MEFKQIIVRALSIKQQYASLEKQQYGRPWSGEELMLGYMKDIGDLARLIQAKEGVRDSDELDKKLAHELSDCLWSVIALADHYEVDLESSFIQTMDEIQDRLEPRMQGGPTHA